MIYSIPLVTMIFWLIGGQFEKGVRRYGVPGFAITIALWRAFLSKSQNDKKQAFKYLCLIPIAGVLSLGYGENSVLYKWLWRGTHKKTDLIVRIVYATLLTLPLTIYSALVPHQLWKILIILPILIVAFIIHTAKSFKIHKFEVLIDDIIRSLAFGGSLTWILV